jgi:hypothetical protein
MNEPSIIINGIKLSNGESMTVRVAIESFYSYLTEEGLGDDEMGIKIRDGYLGCIYQIRKKYMKEESNE